MFLKCFCLFFLKRINITFLHFEMFSFRISIFDFLKPNLQLSGIQMDSIETYIMFFPSNKKLNNVNVQKEN